MGVTADVRLHESRRAVYVSMRFVDLCQGFVGVVADELDALCGRFGTFSRHVPVALIAAPLQPRLYLHRAKLQNLSNPKSKFFCRKKVYQGCTQNKKSDRSLVDVPVFDTQARGRAY